MVGQPPLATLEDIFGQPTDLGPYLIHNSKIPLDLDSTGHVLDCEGADSAFAVSGFGQTEGAQTAHSRRYGYIRAAQFTEEVSIGGTLDCLEVRGNVGGKDNVPAIVAPRCTIVSVKGDIENDAGIYADLGFFQILCADTIHPGSEIGSPIVLARRIRSVPDLGRDANAPSLYCECDNPQGLAVHIINDMTQRGIANVLSSQGGTCDYGRMADFVVPALLEFGANKTNMRVWATPGISQRITESPTYRTETPEALTAPPDGPISSP
jgi:hypothetical protein